MMKRTAIVAGAVVLGLTALFFLANRPLSDLFGYLRAGASTAVKSMEDEIPDKVHDEKTEAELSAARQQLIDRQVQLNLSQNQLKTLENEIVALEEAVQSRQEILASAYPVLQKAIDEKETQVTFVSNRFSLEEFQHEIDDLLAMQKRDENALRIKQQGLQRLAASIADGEAALSEMKNKVLEIEQEFAVLKTRRDQARMEAETLDLVASATADGSSSTASIGKSVDRLASKVETLEARNAARRDIAPAEQRIATGKMAKSFNRLEALKKYAEKTETNPQANDAVTSKTDVEKQVDAKEVVIRIRGDKSEDTVEK